MITILMNVSNNHAYYTTLFVVSDYYNFCMLGVLLPRLVSVIRGRGVVAHCADADRHAQDHIPGGRESTLDPKAQTLRNVVGIVILLSSGSFWKDPFRQHQSIMWSSIVNTPCLKIARFGSRALP